MSKRKLRIPNHPTQAEIFHCQSHQSMIEVIEMVGVAQLVEHWVVAPVVAGSSPVTHPSEVYANKGMSAPFFGACRYPFATHPNE